MHRRKKYILFILLALFITHISYAVTSTVSAEDASNPRFFYNQIRPESAPECASGAKGLNAILNCIVAFTNALKPLAVVLFVLAITISGAYLIFSPVSAKGVDTAKAILLWSSVGFVIVFSATVLRDIVKQIGGN